MKESRGDDADADGNPTTLPPEWLAAMDRIAGGLYPWAALPRLADWLKVPCLVGDLRTILALVDAGWLEAWTEVGASGLVDVLVTFTEWAAERLRVEIIEQGVAERPCWGKAPEMRLSDDDAAERTPGDAVWLPGYGRLPVAENVVVSQKYNALPRFPEVVDPAPGPVEVAIANEAATIAMRTDEVTHYDAEKDETTVEAVVTPLKLWEKEVPVDPKIKGKGGRKSKAKGRKTA